MKNLFKFSFLLVGLLFVSSCLDRDFDEPPVGTGDPDIDASQIISVEELLEVYQNGLVTEIAMDKYISVVVTADDRSGNIYKTLILEDETGGINMQLDDVELWNRFPVGRRLFVNLSQLYISDFNNLPQIGFTPYTENGEIRMSRIPSEIIDNVIEPGSFDNPVTPKTTTIGAIGFKDLNTLVTIDNVEFASNELGSTYADEPNRRTLNRTMEDCNGDDIIVRSSGFADFAGAQLPEGNGSITAVVGVFGNTLQLAIRDINEVMLTGERCSEGGTGGGMGEDPDIDPSDIITISELLEVYENGRIVKIDMDKYISAVVMGNDISGNIFKSLFLQDETGGINIQLDDFDLFERYPVGRRVFIDLSQLYISDFNNLPQIGHEPYINNDGFEAMARVPSSLISSVILPGSFDNDVTPEVVSITDISDSRLNTLLAFENVQFAESELGGTYADEANRRSLNRMLEDCNGNMVVVRSSGYSDFADNRLPQGNGAITAILGVFGSTYQLTIREISDVRLSGTRCNEDPGGGNIELDQNFDDLDDFEELNFEGWTNVATKGTRVWIKRSFQGNGFAEAEAFEDANDETDCWLITPEINTSDTGTLQFRSAMAFFKHDGLDVMISTDFAGDPLSATWENLDPTLASSGQSNYDWVDSGIVDLTSYGSNVYVAFRYQGTSASNTTKFRLDDLRFQ